MTCGFVFGALRERSICYICNEGVGEDNYWEECGENGKEVGKMGVL